MATGTEQTRFWQSRELDGVELLHAHYVQQRFSAHVHEGFVFTVLEQGAQRFRHRGSDHLAPAGSMVLINPDELHTGSKAHEQGWRCRGFYPSNAQVSGVLAELDLGLHGLPAFTCSVVHDELLHRQFLALHQLFDQQTSALHLQVAWREAILQLFQRHARLPDGRVPGHEPDAVRHAKELMSSQLAIPPSLEQLAQAVGLSPFHFARVFRRATGLPPHTWLMQRRLEQARALLKRGCAPLSVAMQLGFADQSHLNRQFKQAYGVAPGQYRVACMGR